MAPAAEAGAAEGEATWALREAVSSAHSPAAAAAAGLRAAEEWADPSAAQAGLQSPWISLRGFCVPHGLTISAARRRRIIQAETAAVLRGAAAVERFRIVILITGSGSLVCVPFVPPPVFRRRFLLPLCRASRSSISPQRLIRLAQPAFPLPKAERFCRQFWR